MSQSSIFHTINGLNFTKIAPVFNSVNDEPTGIDQNLVVSMFQNKGDKAWLLKNIDQMVGSFDKQVTNLLALTQSSTSLVKIANDSYIIQEIEGWLDPNFCIEAKFKSVIKVIFNEVDDVSVEIAVIINEQNIHLSKASYLLIDNDAIVDTIKGLVQEPLKSLTLFDVASSMEHIVNPFNLSLTADTIVKTINAFTDVIFASLQGALKEPLIATSQDLSDAIFSMHQDSDLI